MRISSVIFKRKIESNVLIYTSVTKLTEYFQIYIYVCACVCMCVCMRVVVCVCVCVYVWPPFSLKQFITAVLLRG